MERMERKRRGKENVEEKLKEKIKEGDYYYALQMYKTLYIRILKDSTEKASLEAIELALSAALEFANAKQSTASSEMATLLVNVYMEKNYPVTNENKERIEKINQAFYQNGIEKENHDLTSFLRQAVRWSAENGKRVHGDPSIQLLMARASEASEEYSTATLHYLHAEQPEELGKMIIQWSQKGYDSEKELFIARVVLQYLCLENLRDANIVLETYLKEVSLDTPLVHFLQFLLQTLERDAAPLFQLLKQKYAIALQKDKNFEGYLSVIGNKFYHIKPPQSGLGSLMSMLAGGGM